MKGLERVLGAVRGDADGGPATHMEGDALVVDCRGCDLRPVPGSDECIRCMIGCASSASGVGRIILRTGRDIEISGTAGDAIREVASMMRWSVTDEKLPMYCRSCPASRADVMDAVWGAFPKGAVAEGRIALNGGHPDREGCDSCIARTSATLDRIESGLSDIMRKMASSGRRSA